MDSQQIRQIEGNWAGRWHSETTGGKGRLKCRLVHLIGRHFRAEFRARFWFFLPFSRDIRITFRPEGTFFRCTGTENLGKWAGGNYQYSGTIKEESFQAMFASQKYRGEIELSRKFGKLGK